MLQNTDLVDVEMVRKNRYDHSNRWSTDAEGNDVMPEIQELFMVEWCMVYPRPCTQADWARGHDLAPRSLQNWLSDSRFKRVWRDRADTAYASPEWTQPLIAETYRLALNAPDDEGKRKFSPSDQLKAIRVYAEFVNMTTPKEKTQPAALPMDVELSAMSTADLVAALDGGDEIDTEIA